MRVCVDIRVHSDEIGKDRYSRIVSDCPEADNGGTIWLCESESDQLVQRLVGALGRCGLRPWIDKSRDINTTTEYSFRRWREYEHSDLVSCKYLHLWPRTRIDADRPDNITLRLLRHDRTGRDGGGLSLAKGIACAYYPSVVSSPVRKMLEAEGFVGLEFRPTKLKANKPVKSPSDQVEVDWGTHGEPWWELSSSVRLPPVCEPLYKVTFGNVHTPVPRDYDKGVFIKEPGFSDIELHYRQSELAAVEPFDLALTFEREASEFYRRVVVSKRFYEVCERHKLDIEWRPVRVHE